MRLNADGVCHRCVTVDSKRVGNEPFLFSAANSADPGDLDHWLPDLTRDEDQRRHHSNLLTSVVRIRISLHMAKLTDIQYQIVPQLSAYSPPGPSSPPSALSPPDDHDDLYNTGY